MQRARRLSIVFACRRGAASAPRVTFCIIGLVFQFARLSVIPPGEVTPTHTLTSERIAMAPSSAPFSDLARLKMAAHTLSRVHCTLARSPALRAQSSQLRLRLTRHDIKRGYKSPRHRTCTGSGDEIETAECERERKTLSRRSEVRRADRKHF